jgi:hypothetical protein
VRRLIWELTVVHTRNLHTIPDMSAGDSSLWSRGELKSVWWFSFKQVTYPAWSQPSLAHLNYFYVFNILQPNLHKSPLSLTLSLSLSLLGIEPRNLCLFANCAQSPFVFISFLRQGLANFPQGWPYTLIFLPVPSM